MTDLIGFAEGRDIQVAEGHVKRSVQCEDILARALMQIEEASKNTSAFNGVPSGFMALDRVTLGWQLSDLIIVAARPSMGKTAFVLSMARNMAVDHEQGVAFFLARNVGRAVDDATHHRRDRAFGQRRQSRAV